MRIAYLLPLVIAVLLAGCAPQSNTGDSETVFKIGVIAPLTGDGAVYGLPVQRVIQEATEDLNAQWASEGKRLEVVYEDGKCNGKDGLAAAQKLANIDGVRVIIGGMCSGETLGAAPFTEQQRILIFSPLSSSPDVTGAGDYVFRNYPSDTAQADRMAAFLSAQGYTRVAIISENTDYAQALRERYLMLLPEGGMQIVADEIINPSARDVRSEVAKVQAANPDVVIVLPQTIPVAGIIAKQLFESQLEADFAGNDVVGVDQTLNEYPTELEGFYAPVAVFEMEESPEFLQLKNDTDCELGYYCATTYDSVFLMAELLERCGEDTACMRDFLYQTQGWNGVLAGTVAFDENGDVGGNFQIVQARSGTWVPIE